MVLYHLAYPLVCIIIHTYNKLFEERMEMHYFSEPMLSFLFFKGLNAISLGKPNGKLGENF